MFNVVSNQLKQLILVSYYESLDTCAKQLDVKIKAMEEYILYLEQKRQNLFELIEKYTLELDNKYMDKIEDFKITYAKKLEDHDLVWLQKQINMLESDSAKIEETIKRTLDQIAHAVAERSMLTQMNSLL
ncbi:MULTISPECIES: hypothetical protein [Mammaliicoccus]|jgi:F0F1-type ATP synthase delta subunit|uniref:Staphylococcal protein n=1 Tax=Mammaliicoccus lentus TaxID=42858 RepID=A0AAP1RNQ5_MAMLE|nr:MULTISPECIES: hypothetical protein [Mammaliicoccus]HBV04178.1 hypothetical protein [Staphylococcus sp.]MBF0749523.1 hypothetical protein [Mammaliicoccus lentus]MBF0794677.1 hypothetical protein [Mammaliicoccus lentus]MBF0840127.1 hypothetical protein [Mammaliicoccus lentus]MBU6114466.1 hypothetical protein [Mammaliicoccus lentus]